LSDVLQPGVGRAGVASQRGYSLIKVMVWLVILMAAAWQGVKFGQIYYVAWKVQSTFDSAVDHMAGERAASVREAMPRLLALNYIDSDDLPGDFSSGLEVIDTDHGWRISADYVETIWLLGSIEQLDEQGDYDPEQLTGMDVWRERARIDLHFAPHAGL